MNHESLRKHLIELLGGGHAHVDFDTAIADLPVALRGVRPERAAPHPLAAAGAHEDRPVGHSQVLDRCRPRLARFSRRLLAIRRCSPRPRRVGPSRPCVSR